MLKRITFQKISLLIIILMGTGGLGLFDRLFSLKTPVGVLTESLILIPILLIINTKRILKLNHFSLELIPYTLLIILLVFKIIQNYAIDNVPLTVILNNTRPFFGLFVVYLIIVNFRKNEDILRLLGFLTTLALISSILSIFQYATGNFFDTKFINILETSDGIRFFHRSIWLIALMIIYTTIKLGVTRTIKTNKAFLLLAAMSITILLTMTRSVIVAIAGSLFSILLVLLVYSKQSLNRVFKLVTYSIIGITILFYSLNVIGYRFSGIINRFEEGIFAVKNTGYDDNSHNLRMEMMAMQFNYVFSDSPISGRGLNLNIVEIEGRNNYFEPFARNEDATYQNTMIYFGLSGIAILLLLLISYLRNGIWILRNSSDKKIEAIGLFSSSITIFFVIIGFYGDYFNFNGFCTFSIFSGIIYNLKRNAKKSEDLNCTC